jgi:hypothetical protein
MNTLSGYYDNKYASPSSSTDAPWLSSFLILIIFVIVMYMFAVIYNRRIADKNPNLPRIPTIKRDEVYNIPGNYYTYRQAPALCKALGARIATYDEVEKAYNDGGEWCNYGWSDNQMALFPTQKSTYNTLQGIKGHEHDCGRPGVNGGYISNDRIRFGVNCFGKKHKISESEKKLMNLDPYPITKQDQIMEKQVDFWKNHIDDIILSPFNYNHWSKY